MSTQATVERSAGWEAIRSGRTLVYWRRRLPDGGWLAVKKGDTRWVWRRYPPPGILRAGEPWDEGHRSSSALARRSADSAVADPDRYGPTDTCQTCDMPVRLCGHRAVETRDNRP